MLNTDENRCAYVIILFYSSLFQRFYQTMFSLTSSFKFLIAQFHTYSTIAQHILNNVAYAQHIPRMIRTIILILTLFVFNHMRHNKYKKYFVRKLFHFTHVNPGPKVEYYTVKYAPKANQNPK